MCLFCKIVQNEIPCFKIYEDEYVLAFLDIHPSTYGHTLVIPKEHVETIEEASETCIMQLAKVLPSLSKKIKKNCNAKGINYVSNCGAVAGQEVNHLHFHIIPRYDQNDSFSIQFDPQEANLEEVQSTLLK